MLQRPDGTPGALRAVPVREAIAPTVAFAGIGLTGERRHAPRRDGG